jgi:hypothetical protein
MVIQDAIAGGRGRAGEIERPAIALGGIPCHHRLDHGGIGFVGFVVDGRGQGGDIGTGFLQAGHYCLELFGVQRGQIALQIHHHVMQPLRIDGGHGRQMRSEPEGSSGSVKTARPPAFSMHLRISTSPAATTTGSQPGGHRPGPDPHDHRHPGDCRQRLARQAGRGHTGGDD